MSPICHHVLMNWSNYERKSSQTEVKIYPVSFLYPRMEEIEAMTAKQFLAQLGGNLSLWIGASFHVLVHMVLFIVTLPFSQTRTYNLPQGKRTPPSAEMSLY